MILDMPQEQFPGGRTEFQVLDTPDLKLGLFETQQVYAYSHEVDPVTNELVVGGTYPCVITRLVENENTELTFAEPDSKRCFVEVIDRETVLYEKTVKATLPLYGLRMAAARYRAAHKAQKAAKQLTKA